MIRTGSAVWRGDLEEGRGTVTSDSGTLWSMPYSFAQRFGHERGTNPEELIAAAHAACYAMALAAELQRAGVKPESVETRASLVVEKLDAGYTVTRVHLEVQARIPDATQAARDSFTALAEQAKRTCVVSRLLSTAVTLDRVMLMA